MAPYWDTIKVAGKHLLKWRCWLDLYLKDSVFPKPSSWFSLIPKPAPPSENGTTTYPKSRLHTTHTLFHITHFQTSTNSLPPESPHTFVPETTPRSGHLPLGPPRPLPPSFQSAPVTPVTFLCECKSDSVFPSLPVLFRRTDARVPHLADKIWNSAGQFPLAPAGPLYSSPLCGARWELACDKGHHGAPPSSDLWCVCLRKLLWWLSQ